MTPRIGDWLRPVLLLHGCPHCIEQLNLLAPAAKDFTSEGISIVAVSTDSVEGLRQTFEKVKQEGSLPFPLVSDESLKTFRAYQAYDDFEQMPLHGTFLVDGTGKVHWQDISYEPFTEMKVLVTESRRLLSFSKTELAARSESGH